MDKLSIMGVRINNISMGEALKSAEETIKKDEKLIIYTPNTEIIMMCQKDEDFLNIINKSDINVPDGVGLIYAGKIKNHPLKEMEHMGAAYTAEGIITLAGSRLYTNAAYQDEMLPDILERFERVFQNVEKLQ
jgi:UDP-N-acetyl-D-mannosaminuronic acid transferase (WecB/TagA/CpsF family)